MRTVVLRRYPRDIGGAGVSSPALVPLFTTSGGHGEQGMGMTIEQARDNLNSVLDAVRNPALTRGEHVVLADSLALLYTQAKDNQEAEEVWRNMGAEEEPVVTPTPVIMPDGEVIDG